MASQRQINKKKAHPDKYIILLGLQQLHQIEELVYKRRHAGSVLPTGKVVDNRKVAVFRKVDMSFI